MRFSFIILLMLCICHLNTHADIVSNLLQTTEYPSLEQKMVLAFQQPYRSLSTVHSSQSCNYGKPGLNDFSKLKQTQSLSYGQVTNQLILSYNCNYFSYKENFPQEETIKEFEEMYGRLPDSIDGKPKSSEYGPTIGFTVGYLRHSEHFGLFFRPQISFSLGISHQYDGSSQAMPLENSIGDTIGIKYEPIKKSKNNFFFNTKMDIGFSNFSAQLPFALYSGFQFYYWKRDLISTLYVTDFEKYLWFTVPVGFGFYKEAGHLLTLSIEGALDFMFYGLMKATRKVRFYDVKYYFPEVTLGNKIGYHLELKAEIKAGNKLTLQIVPFADFYGFGKSNTEQATIRSSEEITTFKFYEPESSTFLVGMNINFNIRLNNSQRSNPAWKNK